MDGLLIIDKPAGPTSHDVVARARRALGESRIGHTGTLDPAATGVLALVLGRATRLAQFLTSSDKSYEAVVRFGFATDTGDAQGRAIGAPSGAPAPSREDVDRALDAFRGTFLQQPPAFSAKKIGGKRSHKLARARARSGAAAADARLKASLDACDAPELPVPSVLPAAVNVTVHRLAIVSVEADHVTLSVDCSAGFYVRSLAHDLGERLGIGAHLAALRRTRAGDFTLDHALALDAVERDPAAAAAAVRPMADVLPRVPAVTLTEAGVRRAVNGCELGARDILGHAIAGRQSREALMRLLDPAGVLVGIGRVGTAGGVLHPSLILR